MIKEASINAQLVKRHLERLGLKTKKVEWIGSEEGVRVLGLKVNRELRWNQDSQLPILPTGRLTRRKLHSCIRELVGHYPVASWLRVACGFLQRCTASEGIGWDDEVSAGTRPETSYRDSMRKAILCAGAGQWTSDKPLSSGLMPVVWPWVWRCK